MPPVRTRGSARRGLAAPYPRRQVGDRSRGDVAAVRWPQVPGPVRAMPVYSARHTPPGPPAGAEARRSASGSVTSARTVRTQRSEQAFARGLRGGIFTTSIPAADSTASNASVNCRPGPGPGTGTGLPAPQVHHQVPGLLHCPCAIGVGGHAQDMDMTGPDLDHEEHKPDAR